MPIKVRDVLGMLHGTYVPDLPGCIAVAETRPEVTRLIREALQAHVHDMRTEGSSVPKPQSSGELIEVHA